MAMVHRPVQAIARPENAKRQRSNGCFSELGKDNNGRWKGLILLER
jgi:hypothetical protein